jgi:aminopeptidase N
LFDLQLGGSWGYKGLVKIDLKMTHPTKEIVLNSKDIEVQQAEVFGKDGSSWAQHNKQAFLYN